MRHYWLDLPGPVWFSGADIYARFVAAAEGPSVAVELGAWKGRSTCFMGVEIANSGKPIAFFTVDTWGGSAGETGYEDADLAGGKLFDVFRANIGPVADVVKPIQADTVEAAARFADGSIDFLYIDASHTYRGVMRDLAAWFPKVRTGGTLAGDDWCNEQGGELGVRHAVIDFFGRHAKDVVVLPGSQPNPDWLQWSIVKGSEMEPTGGPARAGRGLGRLIVRTARRCVRQLRRSPPGTREGQ
jgi:hypothetical protein